MADERTRYCQKVVGSRQYDWLDRMDIRDRRRFQRNVALPVWAGLYSRDPQRKIRVEWLRQLEILRWVMRAAPAQERPALRETVRNQIDIIKQQPWLPVLP